MKLAEILAGKKLAARSKVWLELDGHPFFGEGRYMVLRTIERQGSLARASEETGIPYRRMRGAIYAMERAIGVPLVVRSRGGASGGGAALSEAARELMRLFEKQEEGIRERVNQLHRLAFGEQG
ncbi:winged helix-turn-helix domain-containing protein [Geomonas azotofigens]|uniref:winged helix-turn-helix domain-containing protein n=1 Tax=Geomonas azotofigens TaxID=2843196 RepID=UPI001C0FA9C0|nr:LysR family transcriptional regulator [Geomonas azotofigens]MBU5613859.1 LysR family transcriptional regulator [Geomonas azotofigens]